MQQAAQPLGDLRQGQRQLDTDPAYDELDKRVRFTEILATRVDQRAAALWTDLLFSRVSDVPRQGNQRVVKLLSATPTGIIWDNFRH